MAVLQFIGDGNYLETESLPRNAPYRAGVSTWAESYTSAMCHLAEKGTLTAHGDHLLPQQIDATIFKKGVKPNSDQVAPILAGINWGRLVLLADMGTGKTFMGGYIALHWMRHSEVVSKYLMPKKVLIVCPKSVTSEWTSELTKFFADVEYSVFPDDSSLRGNFVIANYEQVCNLVRRRDEFCGVILDESQRIKNIDTQLFDSVSMLLDSNIWHRIVMTGTPVLNAPSDMFTQISLINPCAFPFSYKMMMRAHFSKRTMMNGATQFTFRASSRPLFKSIVNHNAVLLAAKERAAGRSVEVRSFDCTKEQTFHFEAVKAGHMAVVSGAETGMGTNVNIELKNSLIKEVQVSSGFLQAGDEPITFPSKKMAGVYDIVTKEFPTEPIILWCFFRLTAVRLRDALRGAGVTCDIILGGMSNTARKAVTSKFKSGELRVVILQIKACNYGLNLQNCAIDVFVEMDWAAAIVDQAMARIDRQGQVAKCRHIFLYTQGSVDELFITAYKRKRKVTSSIVRTYAEGGGVNAAEKPVIMTRKKHGGVSNADIVTSTLLGTRRKSTKNFLSMYEGAI